MRRAGPDKSNERTQLDLLIRLYPGFPPGRITPSESPDFIIHSAMRRSMGIELTRWTLPETEASGSESRFTPSYSLEALDHLIRKKEALMDLYRKRRLEKIWLVILVNGFVQSPAFNLHNHLENLKIRSSFDAILLLDQGSSKVYEIKPPVS